MRRRRNTACIAHGTLTGVLASCTVLLGCASSSQGEAPAGPADLPDVKETAIIPAGGIVTAVDPAVWTQLTPRPLPADWPKSYEEDALAMDGERQVVWVYGGNMPPQVSDQFYGWDVTRGAVVRPSVAASAKHPPPMAGHAMVFDPRRKVTIVFNEIAVWEWDGVAWSIVRVSQSGFLTANVRGAYDEKRGLVALLVSGSSSTIWMYDPSTPRFWQVTGKIPIYGIPTGFVYDPDRDKFIVTNEGKVGEWDPETSAWRTLETPSEAAAGCPYEIAYLPLRRRFFMLCGASGPTYAFELDASTNTWFAVGGASNTEPNSGRHYVVDRTAGKLLVFGVITPTVPTLLVDIWERDE